MSGDIAINSAASVTATETDQFGISATSNGGTVQITNSGKVSSAMSIGLYSDGTGDASDPDGTIVSQITNSGSVDSYAAGARTIAYTGDAKIINTSSGYYVESTSRQGLVAWSSAGNVIIENAGEVIAHDDHTIQAMTQTGDVTVTNSGTLTSEDDTSLTDGGTGHTDIAATINVSGDVSATNETGVTITALAATGIGIDAETPSGTIDVTNDGEVTSTSSAILASDTTILITNTGKLTTTADAAAAVNITSGSATVTNSGTIESTGTDGIAIRFASGSNILVLESSSTITDTVLGDGDDTLRLDTGSTAFDISLIGTTSQYQGFSTLDVAAGDETDLTGITDATLTAITVEGTLAFSGAEAASAQVCVLSGVIFDGSGTVYSLTVANGTSLSNGLGTLSVVSDATLATGSTYDVSVSSDGSSGSLSATGTVTIESGAILSVSSAVLGDDGSGYSLATLYMIISADTSMTGTFSTVTDDFAFLDASVSYTSTTVDLTMQRNNLSFASQAKTWKQASTAAAIEELGSSNPRLSGLPDINDLHCREGRQAAFRRVARIGHRRPVDGCPGADKRHRQPYPLRIRQCRIERAAGRGLPRRQRTGPCPGNDVRPGVLDVDLRHVGPFRRRRQRHIAGPSCGRRLHRFRRPASRRLARGRAARLRPFQLRQQRTGLVGLLRPTAIMQVSMQEPHYGPIGMRIAGAYTLHRIDTERRVVVGTLDQTLTSDYDGSMIQASAELGYEIVLDKTRLEPFAGLSFAHQHTDSFQESGGSAALSGDDADFDTTSSILGLRADAKLFSIGELEISGRGSLGWRHAYGNVSPETSVRFAGGNSFAVSGLPIARDTAVVEAGLGIAFTGGASLSLDYSGDIADNAQDHDFSGTLRIRF